MPPERFINHEAIDWANDLSRRAYNAKLDGNEKEAKRLREEALKIRMKFGICDEIGDEALDD
jgi:hypothetical protein